MACQPVEIRIPGCETPHGGLMCSTCGMLFGPIFASVDCASGFCDWIDRDPREYSDLELTELKAEWSESTTAEPLA